MTHSRGTLRGWFQREVSAPLDAMYARIDERLLREDREEPAPSSDPASAERQPR